MPQNVSCVLIFNVLSSRWEVIANYMNLHSTSGMRRTAKDVINKAKNLQKLGKITHEEKQNNVTLSTQWK